MIVLDNNEKDIVIPDYNDLNDKPSINGVVLEGNKTAAELGIDIDTTNFYTKIESDERFQLKGNYLTSIPAEYITETELNSKDFATNSDVNDEIGKLDSALSGEISKKQNALVSGENIKTINGESILGDGDIEISGGSVDLSDYYTKGEVDNLIDNVEVDLTGYATETWVGNNYQPKGNYLTSIPSEYVTETELDNKGYLTSIPDEYITESELATELDNKGYLTSIPSEYVTETELTAKNYATKSEIPTIPTNVSSFTNDAGYITNTALDGYATETYVSENYQPAGDYLTSIPSEYVTETELNEALAGLGGSDIPYVVIEYKNAMTLTPISGDLQATLNAAKNKQPFLAYFYNTYVTYGKTKTLYPFTYVTVETSGFSLQYHTEVGSIHKDVVINGSYDTTTGEYSLSVLGQTSHPYVTTTELNSKQDTLVSGTNIKTINGNSILGEGNLTIEGGGTTDLSNYYTKTESDNKFQEKGDYLTTVPSEYVTETELNDAIAGLGGGESVAYLIIKEGDDRNFSYIGGSFEDVVNAYNNNKPYFIYVPNGAGTNYYSLAETTIITDTYIQCLSFAHTGDTHAWRYWRLYPTSIQLYNQTTYEYVTETELNEAIAGLDTGSGIAYLKVNYDETNGYSYDGSFTDIVDAITNNKPYIIYVPSNIDPYYTTIETVKLDNEQITGVSYTHTGEEHYFTYWHLLKDATYIMKTVNEKIYQNELVAGANIKTINGNSLLGSGDMEIVTDLTGYATITYVDEQIGSINTILENIIG